MAPKRANPIEVPPAASSGEEDATSSDEDQQEERSSSSEEEDEEEEDDPKTQSSTLIQQNPPPKLPDTATPSVANEDSEDSGTETGSDSESDAEKPIVKPIATKRMVDSPPVKASSSKRPRESSDQEPKRPKRKAGEEGLNSASTELVKKPGGEDAKKQLFQRLFSEEDEIALLKGMLDFSAKKGTDPGADMNAFYDFVKKSIHTDVTKAQLIDKVRRLRKKFENNTGKGKKGEDRTFSKAHDHTAFELSKNIWGKEGISAKVESSGAKSNGKAKGNNKAAVIALKAEVTSPNKKVDGRVQVQPMEVDNKKSAESSGSLFEKKFGVANMEEVVLKHGLDIIEGEKKMALEAKWRNLQIRELELFVERGEMINDLAKSMLESYKSA